MMSGLRWSGLMKSWRGRERSPQPWKSAFEMWSAPGRTLKGGTRSWKKKSRSLWSQWRSPRQRPRLEALRCVAGTVNSTPFLHVPDDWKIGSPPKMDSYLRGSLQSSANKQNVGASNSIPGLLWPCTVLKGLLVHCGKSELGSSKCPKETFKDLRPELGQGLRSLFSMRLTCLVRWLWSALRHAQNMMLSSQVLTQWGLWGGWTVGTRIKTMRCIYENKIGKKIMFK